MSKSFEEELHTLIGQFFGEEIKDYSLFLSFPRRSSLKRPFIKQLEVQWSHYADRGTKLQISGEPTPAQITTLACVFGDMLAT